MLFYVTILVVCLLGISFVMAAKSAAPWVPMRSFDVSRAIFLAGDLKGKKFVDLGCGNGKTLIAAAKAGAVAEGFEISVLPFLLAKLNLLFVKKDKRPKVFFKSLWLSDLKEVDVVFVFLMPTALFRLKEKLKKELRPGSLVISYVWPFTDWQPLKIDNSPGKLKLYLYKT